MYQALAVPLDGSPFAEQALPLARLLAKQLGAELHLVHVIRPAPDVDFKTPQEDLEWGAKARSTATDYLTGLADEGTAQGIPALTAVLEGRVVPALRDYASEEDVDLIVLTSHGAGGVRRWWLGSVADGLLRAGNADLLLVRPWDETAEHPPQEPRFERVLVPLDGSEMAERALAPATAIASRFGANLTLVGVVPAPVELTSIYGMPGVKMAGESHRRRVDEATEYLSEVSHRIEDVPVERHVMEGTGAAEGIVAAAQSQGAELIVLSSHGRGGVRRAVLGSVADKVIRSSTRPVLVVRGNDE